MYKNNLLGQFIFFSRIKKPSHIQPEYSPSEQKNPILTLIKNGLKELIIIKEKERAIVTSLAEFKTAGVFARKRVKGRNFSYEFGRLPKNIQENLDKAIADVLDGYKGGLSPFISLIFKSHDSPSISHGPKI